MTKGNQKLLCEENLRHAEYYSMLSVFDDLYEKSKSGAVFEDLMPLILKRENILLAYRNIKTNKRASIRMSACPFILTTLC